MKMLAIPAVPAPLVVVGIAGMALGGCSLIPSLSDGGYTSYADAGEPIAYVEGSATLELTGGTELSLILPLQDGSTRDPDFGDQVGFRSDPWAVELTGYTFDGPGFPHSTSWDMTLHDLSHGHWLAAAIMGGCDTDVQQDEQHAGGTIRCVGLQWADAVVPQMNMGPYGSPLPGQAPFDATLTFQATLATPAPTLGPRVPDEPALSGRSITASHILYAPDDDPSAAVELSPIDPAWGTARSEAQSAADALRAIADVAAREAAFAARAKAESDDTGSAPEGGSLGSFTRDVMVSEFGNALFDAKDPKPGDIIGPVRTNFGWHVIMYQGEGEGGPAD